MLLGGAVPLGGMVAGEVADRWGVPNVLGTEALCIAVAAAGTLGLVVLGRQRAADSTPETRG
jgi:hypothetical protein